MAIRYEKYLYIIPDEVIQELEDLKKGYSNEIECYKIKVQQLKKEIQNLNIRLNKTKYNEKKVINRKWVLLAKNKKYNDMVFDFLYPFQFNNQKELKPAIERLKLSIDSIKNQNVNICVCNTSNVCIYDDIKDICDINYIFKPLNIGNKYWKYNKSLTLNYGVKQLIKTPYFFVSDIDLIYSSRFIKTIAKNIDDKKPIRIIFNNMNIDKGFYSSSYNKCKKFFDNHKDKSRTTGIAPGNGLIHLDSFKKIRGYDEQYIGYGPEDADFNFRIKNICEYIELDNNYVNTYHLYHDRSHYDVQYTTNVLRSRKYQFKINELLKDGKFIKSKHLKYLQVNDEKWGEI